MFNLIPSEQKGTLEKEYKLRRLVVWAFIVIITLVVSLILLTPSYILSRTRVAEVKDQLDESKRILDTELQPSELTEQLTEAARNARDLQPFGQKNSAYTLLKILEVKPTHIKITSISFENKDPNLASISLAGTALDRESLKSFGRLMENREEFSAVDLPVSNFAKEKDIAFTMRLMIK